jgi:Uma2 family endonuclease
MLCHDFDRHLLTWILCDESCSFVSMTAIKTQHLPRYRVEDYHRWEGEWELIEGIPFAKSPSANKNHRRAAKRLLLLLQEALDRVSCPCELFYELDLIIDNHTVVRPDLMVFCEDFKNDYPATPPEFVAEIISAGSIQMDREVKMDIYRSFRIKNYLLVDTAHEVVEHYVLENQNYRLNGHTGSIRLGECILNVEYDGIFRK